MGVLNGWIGVELNGWIAVEWLNERIIEYCYKRPATVSCAFVEIWSTWEVWRALKKLDLLSATPRATPTHISYIYLDTFTYSQIVCSHGLVSMLISKEKEYTSVFVVAVNNQPTPFILFLTMTVTTNTSDRPNVSLVHVWKSIKKRFSLRIFFRKGIKKRFICAFFFRSNFLS